MKKEGASVSETAGTDLVFVLCTHLTTTYIVSIRAKEETSTTITEDHSKELNSLYVYTTNRLTKCTILSRLECP